jgi:hypothetical protein
MKITSPYLSSQRIFLHTLFLLFIGLLSIKLYFSSPIFWVISLSTVIFLFYKFLSTNKDPMGFILILFFLSHFSYLDNQGGLWNISSSLIYFFLILTGSREIRFFKTDRTTFLLLLILFGFNMVGWLFISTTSLIMKIEGFIMLSSYMLTFVFISNIKITPFQLRRFFNLLFIISIYLFIAAINQRFGIIKSKLPFLPPKAISDGVIALTTNSSSVFGNSELYGEYCVLILLLTLSVVKSKALIRLFFSKTFYPYIIILLSIFGTFLSGSRSSVLLAVSAIFIVFSLNFLSLNISKNYIRLLVFSSVFIGLFLMLNLDIGTKSSKEDFEQLNQTSFSIQSVISGESINRYETFNQALKRLNSQSWFFGSGIGPLESNKIAWWGYSEDTPYIDFHNLYFSLPMLYGYVGSFVFFLIILRTIFLSIKSRTKISKGFYLKPILIIMPFFWILFLLDEWKISMLRNANYHMLVWMFLGLNMAMIKTIKYSKTSHA